MTSEFLNRASEWFVRLRAQDVSTREREAHKRWIAEDPAHAAAESGVESAWRDLEGLSSWAAAEIQRLEPEIAPRSRRRMKFWLVGAGAASAVGLMAVLLWSMLAPATQSEHFATAVGEQRRVVLEDGSRIHLNSSSAVDVRYDRRERSVRLVTGEGLFDVSHDPGRPFVVSVPGSRVVAVGTRFNVYFVDQHLAVTVLEGQVMIEPIEPAVSERRDSEALLVANQRASLNLTGAIAAIETVDAERLSAWDNGLLVFDNTPLRDVAAEVSRYVGGRIEVAPGVPNYPVTGTIKIRDRETMLRVLSEVAPVTPVSTAAGNTTLMHSPGQESQAGRP